MHPIRLPRLPAVNLRRDRHATMQRPLVHLTIFAGLSRTVQETELLGSLRNIWRLQIVPSCEEPARSGRRGSGP